MAKTLTALSKEQEELADLEDKIAEVHAKEEAGSRLIKFIAGVDGMG